MKSLKNKITYGLGTHYILQPGNRRAVTTVGYRLLDYLHSSLLLGFDDEFSSYRYFLLHWGNAAYIFGVAPSAVTPGSSWDVK